jgi:hypothetical protein
LIKFFEPVIVLHELMSSINQLSSSSKIKQLIG